MTQGVLEIGGEIGERRIAGCGEGAHDKVRTVGKALQQGQDTGSKLTDKSMSHNGIADL